LISILLCPPRTGQLRFLKENQMSLRYTVRNHF